MSADWADYRPADFLLFSGRTYYRLFERCNEAHTAINLALMAAGALVALLLLLRGDARVRRAWPLVLALAWAWSTWAFVWSLYLPIQWAMRYALPVLAAHIAILLMIGLRRGMPTPPPPDRIAAGTGWTLIGSAFLLWPAVAPLTGHGWRSAELFGSAPDPTALASLGFALMLSGTARWVAGAVPMAWCLFAGATLLTLGQPAGWWLLAAPLLALGASVIERIRAPR